MLIQKEVKTSSQQVFIDVTHVIQSALREKNVKNAHILVSVPHTTAGLTVNENADPDVEKDMISRLDRIIPVNDRDDRHAEGNSHAHLKSSLMGTCHPFIVKDGSLVLGTWQGIYFCEFDGPRTRKLIISILNG